MSWVILAIAMAFFMSQVGHLRRQAGRPDPATERRISALEADLAHREDTIALLETRVAELENRLDFAERLLTDGRRD